MSTFQKDLEEINHFLSEYQLPNKELTKELNALVQGADDVVLLLYSRRALEVIITEICEEILKRERGSEPLKGLIDRLYKEKIIPAYIHTSMSNLNSMSTYGAHPKEFNQRQVKTTIIELTTVLEWYINDLKKLDKPSVKNELKQEVKNIEKEKPKTEQKEEKKEEIKEAPVKNTKTPDSEKKVTPAKKKTVGIIVGILVVIAVIVVYFVFSDNNINSESNITEATDQQTSVDNSTPEKVTEIVASEPKSEIEKVIDDKQVKSVEKPKETSIVLPDDIEAAFNKFHNMDLSTKKRAGKELAKRFTNDAFVLIKNTGDSESARDYINGRLLLYNFTYKLEVKEKSGDLISRMIIEEIK